ncbi:MAG: preprotein translocase subunit YajC [Deltaproteobacteria bacterium]|nr:preprotein translocase subunit YajC [Deltaproteobacteria bacterium]
MQAVLFTLLEWFQPAATGGGGGGGGGAGDGASAIPGGCEGGMGSTMPMILAMMAIFYFMLIRPQQKRQKEQDQMLTALRKGVKVRTTGGILGEIFSIEDREVVLVLQDNRTKINVLRSNIAGVEPDPSAKKAEGDDKKQKQKSKEDEG